jgi:hypothetical protein
VVFISSLPLNDKKYLIVEVIYRSRSEQKWSTYHQVNKIP